MTIALHSVTVSAAGEGNTSRYTLPYRTVLPDIGCTVQVRYGNYRGRYTQYRRYRGRYTQYIYIGYNT